MEVITYCLRRKDGFGNPQYKEGLVPIKNEYQALMCRLDVLSDEEFDEVTRIEYVIPQEGYAM